MISFVCCSIHPDRTPIWGRNLVCPRGVGERFWSPLGNMGTDDSICSLFPYESLTVCSPPPTPKSSICNWLLRTTKEFIAVKILNTVEDEWSCQAIETGQLFSTSAYRNIEHDRQCLNVYCVHYFLFITIRWFFFPKQFVLFTGFLSTWVAIVHHNLVCSMLGKTKATFMGLVWPECLVS